VAVTRIGNLSNATTINYATVDGTAKNSDDYVSISGTLQFAPGETIRQLQIPLIDDDDVEATENFSLVLSVPGAGVMQGSPFTTNVTVLDDDRPLVSTNETGAQLHLIP
jgi:hypothetical protein